MPDPNYEMIIENIAAGHIGNIVGVRSGTRRDGFLDGIGAAVSIVNYLSGDQHYADIVREQLVALALNYSKGYNYRAPEFTRSNILEYRIGFEDGIWAGIARLRSDDYNWLPGGRLFR